MCDSFFLIGISNLTIRKMAQEPMPAMDPEDKALLEELGKQLETIRTSKPDTDSFYKL